MAFNNIGDYIHSRLALAEPRLAWRDGSTSEMTEWQKQSRSEISSLIGIGDYRTGDAVVARIVDEKQFVGYSRQSVELQVRDGLDAFAYLLTPAGAKGKLPAVLCLHGHGRGVDPLVGIGEDGITKSVDDYEDYHSNFALQCVHRGSVVLALEQISFGRRRYEGRYHQDAQASTCNVDTTTAFMLGETMAGWRVWDAIRGIDYLSSLPFVDGERLGIMGISGGGMTAFWTACLDERIKSAVVSGYFNTFRASILSIDHCVDNYVPGMLNIMEMPDMAGLVAPRDLFVESGSRDPIFPVDAFRESVSRAQEIYEALGAAAHFGYEVFEDEHKFYGKGAFEFLKGHLSLQP